MRMSWRKRGDRWELLVDGREVGTVSKTGPREYTASDEYGDHDILDTLAEAKTWVQEGARAHYRSYD